MRPHLLQIQHARFHQIFIDQTAVPIFGQVAFGLLQPLQKIGLQALAVQVLHEAQGPAGILNDLHRFKAGEFVEKPAATGVHEHGAALEPHELQNRHLFLAGQLPGGLPVQKVVHVLRVAVQDDLDIVVPGRPGVFQILPRLLFKKRGQLCRAASPGPRARGCARPGSNRDGRRCCSRNPPASAPPRGRNSRRCSR